MKKQPEKKSSVAIFILVLFTLFSHGGNASGATAAEIQQWLQAHNQKRTLHGVPSVTWSATVAASAQAYANTCPSGHSSSEHGENLSWATYIRSVQSVADGWYSEEPFYNYHNPGFSLLTGHFTQVVWKSTTQIGCGYRTGCPGAWPNVWVCQYHPAGNVIGQFAANVFPPGPSPPLLPPSGTAPILAFLWPLLFADEVILNQSGLVGNDGWIMYPVNAPASYSKIKVELNNMSTGDGINIYVRKDANPTTGNYDCVSNKGDTTPQEYLLTNSDSTNWHIGVYGYTGPSDYTVKATLSQ